MENIQSYIDAIRSRGINVIDYSLNMRTEKGVAIDSFLRIVIELTDSQINTARANLRFTALEQHLENACKVAKANKSVAAWVDEGTVVLNGNILEIRSLTDIIDVFLGRILKQ